MFVVNLCLAWRLLWAKWYVIISVNGEICKQWRQKRSFCKNKPNLVARLSLLCLHLSQRQVERESTNEVETNCLVVDILFPLWFQARVALYNINDSKAEILSLVFNATKSSKLNWFSRDRLTHSPWPDLYTGRIRGFDLQGCCGRNFYIFRRQGGCPNDYGWLVVTSNDCAWETRFPSRTVLYSNRTTFIHWNEYGT